MALREINLVVPDLPEQRLARRHFKMWALVLVLVLAAVAGYYIYQIHFVIHKKSIVASIVDVNQELAAKIDQIKKVQLELESLSEQQTFMQSITRNISYAEILHQVSALLGETSWLSELSLKISEDDNQVQMEMVGFTLSNDELGEFLDRFTREPRYRNAELKYAGKSNLTGLPLSKAEAESVTQFEVICNLSRS